MTTPVVPAATPEARSIRIQVGTGPEFILPAAAAVAFIKSIYDESADRWGQHMQKALSGTMPVRRGRPRGEQT